MGQGWYKAMRAAQATQTTKPRRQSTPENAVVRACLLSLHIRGVFAWRSNTGCLPVLGRGGKPRPMRFGLVGSADILGILPGGRFLAVECKSEKGVQTEAQKDFQVRVESAGGLYVLARSAEEMEAWIWPPREVTTNTTGAGA